MPFTANSTFRIMSPTPPSVIGFAYVVTRGLSLSCVSGWLAASRAPMTPSSARASSIDAPGARRP